MKWIRGFYPFSELTSSCSLITSDLVSGYLSDCLRGTLTHEQLEKKEAGRVDNQLSYLAGSCCVIMR